MSSLAPDITTRPAERRWLGRWWHGQLPLWKSFWLIYALGSVVYGVVAMQLLWLLTQPGIYAAFSTSVEVQALRVLFAGGVLMVLLYLVYLAACVVAVWRSAAHSQRVWRILARGWMVLHVLYLLLQITAVVAPMTGWYDAQRIPSH